MSLPDASTFTDVHDGKNLKELKMERLMEYFEVQQKSFDEKYHQLYKQRQVLLSVSWMKLVEDLHMCREKRMHIICSTF